MHKTLNRLFFLFVTKTFLNQVIIPYYHLISDEDVVHIKNLYNFKNQKQFEEDLDFLLKYFKPITLLDLIENIKNQSPIPTNTFLLTFDDGLREVYDNIAPIVLRKGIPATFFITTAFLDNRELAYDHKASLLVEALKKPVSITCKNQIQKILEKNNLNNGNIASLILSIRYPQKSLIDEIAESMNIDFQEFLNTRQPYLTSDQIKKLLEQGFTLGAHSIDHPYYNAISLEQQLTQTIESVKTVREKFSLHYGAFAFPHHDNGVSVTFFEQVKKSRLIDITFGTNCLLTDCIHTNFQRINFEKSLNSADQILNYETIRKFYKNLKGQGQIRRI